jgi:hypothetical protein
MIHPATEQRIARILLGLDTASREPSCVAEAVALAALLDAELTGVFVEDADLLRIAGLPFSLETPVGGGDERTVDVAGMERALRARARELERELGRLAEGARVHWQFRVVRGRRVARLLEEVSQTDVLFFSRSPLGPITEGIRAEPGVLVVVLAEGDSSRRALALAARVAAGDRRDVAVLDAAAEGGGAAAEARSALAGALGRVTVRRLGALDYAGFAAALKGLRPSLLLLPADSPALQDPVLIERLRRTVAAPLVIVR